MRYQFADCVLDAETLRVIRAGEPVHVEPQVFDLIRLLVENPRRVLSKEEVVDVVWHGRAVSDSTIAARINAARAALGDDGQRQAIIGTVPRRGIELRVPVVVDPSSQLAEVQHEPGRQRIKYARSSDGTRIAFASSGSGPPLMRMSHHLSHLEMDWTSDFWRPLFARLGAKHTLVRYDTRGTGLSDANLEGAGVEEYVADMKAVVDAAGLESFPLVTTLQSAPVALRFIAANPGRVSRLVVHEGYVRGRALRAGSPSSQDSDPVIALMQNGWGDPENGFMRAWMSMIIPNASRNEITEMIKLISNVATPANVVAARRIIDKFTAEDILHKIRVPTLIIHARNDTIHPVDEARELAMGIDGAELMIVESSHTLAIPSDPTWEAQMQATMEFLAEG